MSLTLWLLLVLAAGGVLGWALVTVWRLDRRRTIDKGSVSASHVARRRIGNDHTQGDE